MIVAFGLVLCPEVAEFFVEAVCFGVGFRVGFGGAVEFSSRQEIFEFAAVAAFGA